MRRTGLWFGLGCESAVLPQTTPLHKHGAVGRDLKPRLRTLLAMLCVALSFVFAGASAASVVDGVQHAARGAHHHGLHLSFSMADDDRHDDGDHHHDDGDHQDQGGSGDHQTGAGHHHADAPVTAPTVGIETGAIIVRAEPVRVIANPSRAKGVRPGGLDRPPKTFANLT